VDNQSRPRFRPDFHSTKRYLGDERPPHRVLAHYLLERELSDRLRRASRTDRHRLYTEVYQELFVSLNDHPQRKPRVDNASREYDRLSKIAPALYRDSVFLEIGCGDAAVSFQAAEQVRVAYGFDVTEALIDFSAAPPNFTFLHSCGAGIPLPSEVVDLAYSNQLLEHLHPDDAADQLREVWRVLKSGGHYVCITPNRVTGPHDISCYFDYAACGLHLQEYDYGTLKALFHEAGFRKFACKSFIRDYGFFLPSPAVRALEYFLLLVPNSLRAALARVSPVQSMLGLNFIAVK